jgi:hypothetical protein
MYWRNWNNYCLIHLLWSTWKTTKNSVVVVQACWHHARVRHRVFVIIINMIAIKWMFFEITFRYRVDNIPWCIFVFIFSSYMIWWIRTTYFWQLMRTCRYYRNMQLSQRNSNILRIGDRLILTNIVLHW